MAAEDLPSEFDVVILGTGLCESVVAAAFSRVGQKVLHLDSSSYYAANWASFTFNGLLSWIQEQQEEPKPAEAPDWSSLCEEGEELVYLSASPQPSVRNIQVFCFTSEEEEEEEAPNTTEEEPAAGETEAPNTTEEEPAAGETEAPEETKEEEPSDGGEEAAETEGAGLEADQPITEEPPTEPEPTKKKKRISYKQLVKEGRRFNIDLVSKLLYSRGSLVDLLIKSNVSRYAEFKNVTRILTYRNGRVEQVPCSRADVFSSRQLSVIEKRKLMRFLTSCLDDTQDQSAYNGRPYLEFLSDQNLGENLQHFLFHSISMATEATPTEVGLAATRHFLQCLGRYGNTPFLFPVYGLGEIPQCFCRMCAVFGGIYCLRHSVSALLKDKDNNRCKAVIDSRGQRISCSHFIVEEGYVEAGLKREATPPRFLSRAVLITDGSILPSDSDQQVSMVTVPPIERESPSVKMVELCSSTMTCMAGTYLVHLTCASVGSAYEDLSPLVTRMFNTTESDDQVSRPSVLWCVYFNMADGGGLEVKGHDLPTNVHLCSGPDTELGAERAVRQAESIFKEILPEEDFCPPAPNPEDILYDAETGTNEEETAPGTNEEESMATEQGTDSNETDTNEEVLTQNTTETDTNEQEETASGLQEEKHEEEEEKGEGPTAQTEE